jgi:hypothetical protein
MMLVRLYFLIIQISAHRSDVRQKPPGFGMALDLDRSQGASAHIYHGVGPTAPGSHVVCHVLDLAVRDSSTAATILEANQSASLTAKLHAIREAVKESSRSYSLSPPSNHNSKTVINCDRQGHTGPSHTTHGAAGSSHSAECARAVLHPRRREGLQDEGKQAAVS